MNTKTYYIIFLMLIFTEKTFSQVEIITSSDHIDSLSKELPGYSISTPLQHEISKQNYLLSELNILFERCNISDYTKKWDDLEKIMFFEKSKTYNVEMLSKKYSYLPKANLKKCITLSSSVRE